MNNEFKSVDGLVSEIVGTANIISKIFFNKNSVMIAAAISIFLGVLIFGS
ncbi:MAG: hypothetical protein MUO62_11450 [Anaerolineales bacterium]|nr:hypothetical protein [Anaerolineales bacterium]